MPQTVLVTGASGFIGSALVRRLRVQGIEAVGVARHPGSDGRTIEVSDYETIAPPAGATIVHLAEARDVGAVEHASEAMARTLPVVRSILSKGIGRFVYASSAVVYGDRDARPRREDDVAAARNKYAENKLACEREVLARGGAVARLANTYGPGMAPNNLVSDILRQLRQTGPVELRALAPVRDWIWVDDVADALVAMAVRNASGIYNVGSGEGISAGDLAQELLSIDGQPGRPIVARDKAQVPSTLVLDIAKARRDLEWQPKMSRAVGLTSLVMALGNRA